MDGSTFKSTKVALYGATGTRKTLQIGNLIREFGADRVGVVSCERGLGTIASAITNPNNVFVADSWAQFRQAFAWASERFTSADSWVCVDGGTRVMQWNAGEIWGGTDAVYTELALGKPKHELSASLRPFLRFITGQGDIDGQRQWVQIGRDADRLLNAWVKLPCNIYWTFWETQTSLDQYRKGLPWQVDAPGTASRDAIMGTFDFVGRLSYEDGKLVGSFDPTSRVNRAKVRDDWNGGIKIPAVMSEFNLAELVKLFHPIKEAVSANV